MKRWKMNLGIVIATIALFVAGCLPFYSSHKRYMELAFMTEVNEYNRWVNEELRALSSEPEMHSRPHPELFLRYLQSRNTFELYLFDKDNQEVTSTGHSLRITSDGTIIISKPTGFHRIAPYSGILSMRRMEGVIDPEWEIENGLMVSSGLNHEKPLYELYRMDADEERAYFSDMDEREKAMRFLMNSEKDSEYLTYGHVTLDGEPYRIVIYEYHDLARETLQSEEFLNYIKFLGGLCTVLLFIAMAWSNLYYDKNLELEKARTAFVSGVAHEMKTPLAIIRSQCECVLDDVAPEKNREYVQNAYREAGRLNKLIMSFLQYNRLKQLDRLPMEDVPVNALLKAEVERYLPLLEDGELACTVTGMEDNIHVNCKANSELLTLAVDNLLNNAMKYTSAEDGKGRVRIEFKAKDSEHFRFIVYNDCNPKALPPDDELWEILSRGDASRNRSGNSSGMGLAITAEILRLHGMQYGIHRQESGVEFFFGK